MGNESGRQGSSERGTSNRMTNNRIGEQAATRRPSRRPADPVAAAAKPAGASKEFNWLEKLKTTRKSIQRIEVKYTRSGMLGKPPHKTELGKQIWSYVRKQKAEQYLGRLPTPLDTCTSSQFVRVRIGYKAAMGVDIFDELSDLDIIRFLMIAFSNRGNDIPRIWKLFVNKKLPRILTGKPRKVSGLKRLLGCGVPGALAFLGKAKVINKRGIWAGELEPGAPMQFWDVTRLATGHGSIFERYVRDNRGTIVGLVYSDQWMDYRLVRKPGSWRWMFGAKFH